MTIYHLLQHSLARARWVVRSLCVGERAREAMLLQVTMRAHAA